MKRICLYVGRNASGGLPGKSDDAEAQGITDSDSGYCKGEVDDVGLAAVVLDIHADHLNGYRFGIHVISVI